MSLANLALDVGRREDTANMDVVDIVTFVESPWGLNQKLFPVQKVILKAHYGIALDDTVTFKVSDWRREVFLDLTEAGYLKFLHEEGRCNISEVIPGEGRRKMVLAIGRRSGKSFLASCIAAYETYKLISKGHPQGYYGLPDSNAIQLIAVATDKEQAGLLYREVHGHFLNCLAADTEIITAEGIQPIGPLAGTTQTVLAGNGAWVEAPIRSFGKQQLYKLTLSRNGIEKIVYATADHRWFARDARKQPLGKGFVEFKTTELRPGKHQLQQVYAGERQWSVKAVEPTDRVEEVFCATVPGVGSFALEGNVVTGNCDYFAPYMANSTTSFATFQTPYDIARFGSAADNPKARYSVRVTFRSCIAKGLRGPGNIMMILDEMAHFTDDGQSSAKEVYNAIAPSTSAFSPKDPNDARVPTGPVEGRIVLISSPLGRQGHFYDLFSTGMRRGSKAKDWLCIQAPTWEVNPSIPSEEFEGFYAVDPRVFFTEYGAEFSDRTRGWIESAKDLLCCVDPNLRPARRAPARMPHFMGVDVALVGDGTAIAIGHLDHEGKVVVDLVDYIKAGEGEYEGQERLDFDAVADWIYGWTKKFYIEKGMFDQWAGIPLEQALEKRGLKQFESVHHTKILNSQIFRNFKNMMFDERLRLYDDPSPDPDQHAPYIAELLTLQEEQHSKYVITVEAPNAEGMHDDMSDALVRMVWLATKHTPKVMAFGNPTTRPGQSRVTPQQRSHARLKAKLGGSHPSRQPGLYGRRGGTGGTGRGGRGY